MFHKIFLPIDLHHADKLKKARQVALDLAKHYNATLLYAAVTTNLPDSDAHTPEEFEARLRQLAEQDTAGHGVETETHVIISHDPTADLDNKLLEAIRAEQADVVIMATHVPNLASRFWQSNGGWIADHADISVFLIRSA
ncbi:universal stress protein [Roseibium sp.]|uniref:universal stress protein n=1 Tax=Roseibium sp. TaxID=1936156 RepID=UPI003A985612